MFPGGNSFETEEYAKGSPKLLESSEASATEENNNTRKTETITLESLKRKMSCKRPTTESLSKWLKENLILILTLSGVLLGIALGIGLRGMDLDRTTIYLIGYPGEIFMRILKLFILPLVISSIISGSASLNAKTNGKMAIRTLLYFGFTTLLNSFWGTALAVIVRPGNPELRRGMDGVEELNKNVSALDSFLDLGRNLFPDNIFGATFEQAQTSYSQTTVVEMNEGNRTVHQELIRVIGTRAGTNTLGVIVFCFAFGIVLGTIGKKGEALIRIFKAFDEVIMRLVSTAMWLTPVGVASIICGKILSIGKLMLLLESLGLYIVTIVGGVVVYQALVMPLLYFILVRKNPYRFWFGLLPAELTSFATASTAVALPISFRCMDKMGFDDRVTHFVLPIGSTVNMDGTAMFVSIASLFVAQLNAIPLTLGDYATVMFTSAAASIAAASVPSAALVLMLIVLTAINCPTQDVAILYTVDWLVDRFRTTNNMLGDCYTAAIVEKLSQEELQDLNMENYVYKPVENGVENLKASETTNV